MTRLARLALTCAGAGTVAVGCGGTQPAAPVAPPAASRAVVLQTPGYEADSRVLARARERLAQACMQRAGFRYDVVPLLPPLPATTLPRGEGYGLLDAMSRAARARAAARAPAATPQVRYVAALAPRVRAAYVRTLEGTPRHEVTLDLPGGIAATFRTDGCEAAAAGRLYGDVRQYQVLVARQNDLSVRLAARIDPDGRLRAAGTAWARCVRVHGVHAASPADARADLFNAYVRAKQPARVAARERATARADRACGRATGFYAALARAENAAAADLSAGDRARAARLARDRAAAVARARAVLAAPGSRDRPASAAPPGTKSRRPQR